MSESNYSKRKETCAKKIPLDQAAPKEIIALRLLPDPTFTSNKKVPYPIHNAMGDTMYGIVLLESIISCADPESFFRGGPTLFF